MQHGTQAPSQKHGPQTNLEIKEGKVNVHMHIVVAVICISVPGHSSIKLIGLTYPAKHKAPPIIQAATNDKITLNATVCKR